MKFLLPVILAVTSVALTTAWNLDQGRNLPNDFSFKSLSNWDKLKLILANKFSPSSFQNFPAGPFAEVLYYDGYPSIDNSFIDARQLFTQVKKVPPTASLPELKWGYAIDFCFWLWCIDIEVAYSTGGTKFLGAETITTKTEFTPTTFTNTFKVPSFNWTSPGFLVNVTDYRAQKIHLTQNSFYSFENTTIAFTGGYNFVPDVGIQVDNMSIYYNAGRVRGGVHELTVWDFDGNLLEREITDPEDFPIDNFMMENWGWAKRGYTERLQHTINCLVSNGRSDPDNCLYGDNGDELDDLVRDYLKFHNLQLILTMGLGALLE